VLSGIILCALLEDMIKLNMGHAPSILLSLQRSLLEIANYLNPTCCYTANCKLPSPLNIPKIFIYCQWGKGLVLLANKNSAI
jgi:hypothetical protein